MRRIRTEHLTVTWLLACTCGLLPCAQLVAQDDIADIPHKDLRAGGDKNKRYFLIGEKESTPPPPQGYGLLVVLPGGDGGPDFLPFVKRVYKRALPKGYLVAQLVGVKWTDEQRIVWGTERVKVDKQEFSTEQFVEAVVNDVEERYRLNDRIFVLGWSSGGPAAYAVSMSQSKPVTGALVAMSVFKPKQLEALSRSKGLGYFLLHSEQDKVCPFRMAKDAQNTLSKHGAKVELKTYKGGHGWKGNVFGQIREGIDWLEKNRAIFVRPGVGVGAVKLGMSKAEVIALLGKPDKLEGRGTGLNYISSRGLAVLVSPRRGVVMITCFSGRPYRMLPQYKVATFRGLTTKGITVDSTREEIIKAYGRPDRARGGALEYKKLGIMFGLMKNRVAQIGVMDPK